MKKMILTVMSLVLLIFISCGPSAEDKAKQKAHEDSLVKAAVSSAVQTNTEAKDADVTSKISDLQAQVTTLQGELYALNNDKDYLYYKTRLATVRARVSTGGSYGWISGDGEFWAGKDANAAFDAAAKYELNQLKKIEAKTAEIKVVQGKISDMQDLLTTK